MECVKWHTTTIEGARLIDTGPVRAEGPLTGTGLTGEGTDVLRPCCSHSREKEDEKESQVILW